MFLSPNNLNGPPLYFLYYDSVFLAMESSKLDTDPQMSSGDENRSFHLFWIYNLLCTHGWMLPSKDKNMINLLCMGTRLTRISSLIYQNPHICKAVLYPANIQPMLVTWELFLVAYLCICFQFSAGPILQALEDPLNGRQPCPQAYQPVPPSLMLYIMSWSYSQA